MAPAKPKIARPVPVLPPAQNYQQLPGDDEERDQAVNDSDSVGDNKINGFTLLF